MSGGALILTYHAIEEGPAPLCVEPALFERHLDCIVAAGSRTVTVATLAEAVRRGERLDGLVAITFDDGFASVARTAWPLLAERGLTATVFCVAGYLGGANDWPTQATGAPRLPLCRPLPVARTVSREIVVPMALAALWHPTCSVSFASRRCLVSRRSMDHHLNGGQL